MNNQAPSFRQQVGAHLKKVMSKKVNNKCIILLLHEIIIEKMELYSSPRAHSQCTCTSIFRLFIFVSSYVCQEKQKMNSSTKKVEEVCFVSKFETSDIDFT